MNQYKFNPNNSERIVNAIVEGYRDYVDHRKDRYQQMAISSAFAWTKGNFIESKLAEYSPSMNLEIKMEKAGLTWDYLQFIQDETKILFLIKNAAYFNENCFSHALIPTKGNKRGHRRTYLNELSKINQHLDFPSTQPKPDTDKQIEQLSLFVPKEQIENEIKQVQSTYNEFHILTYKIDEAQQIAEIMHYLPNPINNIAYKIEDLSEYISGAELTDEEREVIAPEIDNDIIDPDAFDIGIFDEEDKESN